MRIIRIDIYTKGGTFQVWPTNKLFPEDDDTDLAREIVSSTVDIDANCIRAIDLYSSEEDYYVYEYSNNRVVAAEEIGEDLHDETKVE